MTLKCQKKIAILMAAYNSEKYIEQQILSIIRQTNDDWVLYIRNDGSIDGTQSVIDRYKNAHSNIVQIDQGGKNLGCRNNFFRLLEEVESEYYMFCDADDVWFDDKIEISILRMQEIEKLKHEQPILVHTDSTVCDENLNVIDESYWKSSNINPDQFLTLNLICVCCPVGGSTMLLNRLMRDLMFPLQNNGLMFDYWIAINAVKYGVISTIHRPTRYYRQHGNNVCGVATGSERKVINKLKNLSLILKTYKKEAEMLDQINYGGFIKYLYFKIIATIKMRVFR